MIYQIYEYCSITPHNQIYFIAHNGFNHDFIILFDNLEKSHCFNIFREFFGNAIFLDSLIYFKSLNVFPSISLENLYKYMIDPKKKTKSYCKR